MTNAKESYEMMTDLAGKSYESAKDFGEINLRAMEKLAARQIDAVSLALETGMRQIKMFTEAKGINELVKAQIEMTRELGERAVAETRENMRLAIGARDDYRSWMEKGVRTVSDKVNALRPAI